MDSQTRQKRDWSSWHQNQHYLLVGGVGGGGGGGGVFASLGSFLNSVVSKPSASLAPINPSIRLSTSRWVAHAMAPIIVPTMKFLTIHTCCCIVVGRALAIKLNKAPPHKTTAIGIVLFGNHFQALRHHPMIMHEAKIN